MREKILAQLISKYAGVSKKFLGLVADKLAKKVTEESGIDQAITDYDNAVNIAELAADFQKEGDTRVGEAKKEWEKKPKPGGKPKTDDNPDDPDAPKPDDAPVWAKNLMSQVEKLTKEKSEGTIRARVSEKLKEIPELFWKGRTLPDKEEDLQGFIDAVSADYQTFKQQQVDAGVMSATPPAGGGTGEGKEGKVTAAQEKVIDAEIKSWADKGKAPAAKTA